VPVTRTTDEGTSNGDANETTEKFGPLKVVLGDIPAIYADQEGFVAVGNTIEVLLSHIVALEERFDSCPSDVAELRCRDELIQYALVLRFPLGSESLIVNLSACADNWFHFAGTQGWSRVNYYPGSSKIYERPSSTIRLPGKRRSTTKAIQSMISSENERN